MLTLALRSSALSRLASRRFIGGLPFESSALTVAEKVVNVVLVDYEGNRHVVKGRVGQTLREACEVNNVDYVKDDSMGGGGMYDAYRDDYYTESLFGEGSTSPQSHVIVSNEWISKLQPANNQERHIIDTYVPAEDRSANSRLGTEIVLHKELDGLVVAVPESPPVEEYRYDHEYDEDDYESYDDEQHA
ncbi:Ferredoxin [Plasmopara halstedii]|uniref:Ferredoxin n=1 Tax=Plasmopara halstedii TaxID=4781 RepID=A0A0P1AYA3_PLAHL|nr:Ferredoxin [Plasmopara halstedii]CEG46327.1 Ferredoxin [Plasmopara halstedii]|eukprot:XP_024582696.1 Ferredoxin [Plasmopara halstedii]